MKIKTILIVISCITLLFTSCQKDEMEKGGTDGGGMTFNNKTKSSIAILRSLEQNTDYGTVNVSITNTKGERVFDKNIDTTLKINPSINKAELPSDIYYIDILAQDGKTIQHDSFTIK